MPPLREYVCLDCGWFTEELIRSDVDVPTHCLKCQSTNVDQAISAPGGYLMDSGPASVRPRGAGSFKRRK